MIPFQVRRFAAMASVIVLVAGCGTAATPRGPVTLPGCPTAVPPHATPGTTATATIETPKGTIVIKLEADLGRAAVGNFIALATCGYFNGVVFHRIVPGFVIQGGDGQYGRLPDVDSAHVGNGGPGYSFVDDPVNVPYARGTVAMANSGANTNGSQFFIVLGTNQLEPRYSVFGHVASGMEVADAISKMPNSGGQANAAIDPVPMTKVTITTP
jgi:cyclophilin family peptidyl-prolyl cis-trans isomerase